MISLGKLKDLALNVCGTFRKSAFLLAISLGLTAFTGTALGKETVTIDSFVRAETDRTMATTVASGGFGKFVHNRQLVAIDKQNVIRMNRDTLYSSAVFDLTTPVTITLPDSKGRYMSALVVNQDHSMQPMEYAPGKLTLTKDMVGTRYAIVILRTFVDGNDAADVTKAHALQDRVKATQSDAGIFEVPDWNLDQLKTLRSAINVLAATKVDQSEYFGDKSKLDPIDHLLGTAYGWGGIPKEGAIYLSRRVETNDGEARYTMTISDPVPIENGGFFSITIYNADGYMEANELGVYSYNNVTAKRNRDGSLTINAGGCGDGRINCIPTPKGWSYHIRMFKPSPKILTGEYQFPIFEAA